MKQDMTEALQAIASMIERSEKVQKKFAVGTSQHTLQENRINALYIASSLIQNKLSGTWKCECTEEDLKKAMAPIASLISKSEKSQQKLTQGTWQYTMLENNLKALYIALPLVESALSSL